MALYENGHFRKYQDDWVQRLKAVKEYTDPVNFYLTQYTYNQAGNFTQVINAHGEPVTLEYDSLFGPTRITYPDGTTRSYTYDSRGNMLTRTDGSKTTFYTYDAAYRQTQIQYPDQTVQFTYDPNGNRLSVTNDYSTKTYSYNNRNNMVSMTQQIDSVDYTVAYTYDASGKVTSLTYPDGTVITQVYDDLNRLTSIDNYAEFTYSKDSLPETLTYTNGVVTTFTYDQCHRPLSTTAEKNGVDIMNLEYNYDSVGNLLQLTTTWLDPLTYLPDTATESFGYDALDRLLSATNGSDTVSFMYDPAGNRLHHVINGYTTEYTYLPNNKLATAGEWTFFYDSNGNTVSKTSTTDQWLYQYDGGNNLTHILHNGLSAGNYVYDGDGYRIKKTEWNSHSQQYETTIYLFSQGSVCYEKNTTTGLDAIYVYGPTGRLAKKVGDESMYYHTDHLGSTRLLTDTTGSPVTAVAYSPFGKVEQSTGEPERYLFTGQEIDTTGLYYYKARYYDPETGRFLTQDKWAGDYRRPQSLNKYTYCVNNPLRYADPSGNVATFADEIILDIMAKEPEEQPSESETPDPAEFARMLSELVTLMIIENCDPNGWNTSRQAMLEAEAIFDDPEQRKEFERAWKETFNKTFNEYSSPEAAAKRLEEAQKEFEGDLNCLIKYSSEGLWGVATGLIPSPTGKVEILRTLAYVAREYYNITTGDEYNAPPPSLDELCRKEENGTCSGTIFLWIFLGLAILVGSIQHRKGRLP